MLTLKKPALQGALTVELWFVPKGTAATSFFVAVGGASANVSTTLASGNLYVFSSSTDCWCSQGSSPTATKAAGSWFCAKGIMVLIDGSQGATLAVLQDSAAGNCSLTPVDA